MLAILVALKMGAIVAMSVLRRRPGAARLGLMGGPSSRNIVSAI